MILRTLFALFSIGVVVPFIISGPVVFGETPVGWRTDGTGRYPDADPPLEWSAEKSVLWKAALPKPSHSAPLVVEDSVFVTSEPSQLICVSAVDGKALWERSTDYSNVFDVEKVAEIAANQELADELKKQERELRKALDELQKAANSSKEEIERLEAQRAELNEKLDVLTAYPAPRGGANGNTTATPVSDGESVYVAYGTGLVANFTIAGKRRWTVFVEGPSSNFGHSASPVLVQDKLILHYDNLIALDSGSGKQLWQADVHSRFGSPIAGRIGETDVIVTPGGAIVRAHDGHVLCQNLFGLGHNSPIVHNGVLYAFESGSNKAYELPETLDHTVTPRLLWESSGFRQRTFASPVFDDGLLYTVTEKNIMDVLDASNGELVYRKRLDFGNGRVYPSVTLAGNYLFASSDNGTTLVLEPGREYREVARNELEEFSGSPVFIGTRMYVRGKHHLYCIGK